MLLIQKTYSVSTFVFPLCDFIHIRAAQPTEGDCHFTFFSFVAPTDGWFPGIWHVEKHPHSVFSFSINYFRHISGIYRPLQLRHFTVFTVELLTRDVNWTERIPFAPGRSLFRAMSVSWALSSALSSHSWCHPSCPSTRDTRLLCNSWVKQAMVLSTTTTSVLKLCVWNNLGTLI